VLLGRDFVLLLTYMESIRASKSDDVEKTSPELLETTLNVIVFTQWTGSTYLNRYLHFLFNSRGQVGKWFS
jgi:hypothetical protein